jgi:hypothetical protein
VIFFFGLMQDPRKSLPRLDPNFPDFLDLCLDKTKFSCFLTLVLDVAEQATSKRSLFESKISQNLSRF